MVAHTRRQAGGVEDVCWSEPRSLTTREPRTADLMRQLLSDPEGGVDQLGSGDRCRLDHGRPRGVSAGGPVAGLQA